MVFDASDHRDHEQVTYFSDEETGLQTIVALHDTTLGPGLGGTRMLDYETEQAALTDVLRLSYAMTYKAAAADLDLGGGKAVIVGDPEIKDKELLQAYGRAVDRLGGRYITSVDVNTSVADMDVIAGETEYVTGTSGGLGDPSPVTAHGVFHGMDACVEYVYGRDTLSDLHVVVQGVGKVGAALTTKLVERGTKVTIADPNDDVVADFVEEYGVESVPPEAVYDVSCDVFAPCAMGGALNDDTISRLDCDIVAGAANNILADETRHAKALDNREIVYAPDYVLNAGGLITVAKEHLGGTRETSFEESEEIGDRLLTMLERAEDEDTTVLEAARRYVEDRLNAESQQTMTASNN